MSDTFTTTTYNSYGSRIKNSFLWGGAWVLLFLGSFYVLFTNEWRVDYSVIAKESIVLDATSWQDYEWKFVSLSWDITSQEQLGDPWFIQLWDYLILQRITEMYAWEETKSSSEKENLWWSSTTTTTYTYNKTWKENPRNSWHFAKPEWHHNPEKSIRSQKYGVENASIDTYNFSFQWLRLPGWKSLSLSESILDIPEVNTLTQKEIILQKLLAKRQGKEYIPPADEKTFNSFNNKYIFIWEGSLSSPKIWDVRVHYLVLNQNTFWSIFGLVEWDNITSYNQGEDISMYHLFTTHREGSIQELRSEYLTTLWMIRVGWFFMMSAGLYLIFSIFSIFLAVVPIFAKISRYILWAIAFLISLVLSVITILIGMIAHNIFLLVPVVIIVLVALVFWVRKLFDKKTPTPNINTHWSDVYRAHTSDPHWSDTHITNISDVHW